MAKKLPIAAVIGAVAGVVAGVLVAPKSGRETRDDITKRAKELKKGSAKKLSKATKRKR